MSLTTDEDLLFQADQDLERREARKGKLQRLAEKGQPVKLSTKALDLIVRGNDAWTAESGFVARRTDLQTGSTTALFRGHTGPVTCLALHRLEDGRLVLLTGSWDKSVRVWDTSIAHMADAHSDFVKALLVVPSLRLLVTGGSDRDVRLWDLAPLEQRPPGAPTFLRSLKAHTRPVERLAMHDLGDGRIALWSADSMGRICVWSVGRTDGAVTVELQCEWLDGHATAVYDMFVDPTSGELWTASGDNSLLLSRFDPRDASKAPTPVRRVPHPYFVRTVLPLHLLNDGQHVLTGSTDEAIRVFEADVLQQPDPASLAALAPAASDWKPAVKTAAPPRPAGLLQEIEAHAHEVNRLALWVRVEADRMEPWIVSTSLDSTLRRWPLADLVTPPPPPEPVKPAIQLSADEEAELAKLMDD